MIAEWPALLSAQQSIEFANGENEPHPPAPLFHLDNRESSIENRQRENKWANINHSNLRQIALMIMSHKILCTKSPRRERERENERRLSRDSISIECSSHS